MNPEDRDVHEEPMDETQGVDEADADSVRDLLRGAFRDDEPPPDVLRGVQRKLRERSGGKFYEDRWSTSRHPPIAIYLVTSAVMLAILLLAYAVMSPLSGEPVPVRNEPAPIQVIPR